MGTKEANLIGRLIDRTKRMRMSFEVLAHELLALTLALLVRYSDCVSSSSRCL